MLRKHQAEMDHVIDEIIAGSGIKEILCNVTPGGGKSMLPIIAGKLITAGFADALCWIVPRKNLQEQGEGNFVDPVFREMLNHNLTIRSSTNDVNPCRDLNGFATTYQAVGFDGGESLLHEFKNKRFILILDEFHHVEKDGVWHEALNKIVGLAEFVVYMTGTIERGRGNEIAFIPYVDMEDGTISPCVENTETMAVIEYTRKDALKEKAILPIKFFLNDGKAKWIDKKGKTISVSKISKAYGEDAAQAVFTVLHSEFADQLLIKSINHWLKHRKKNPRSKILIVTADYEMAKDVTGKLKKSGFNASIATSHESVFANRSIRLFKCGSIDVLVTIAMAYEGLDCPEITHICCLTNIRTFQWIMQMVARAVRVDRLAGPYEAQSAFVFAPEDVSFRKIVKAIEREQLPYVQLKEEILFEEDPQNENGGQYSDPEQITPLSSAIISDMEMFLGPQSNIRYLPKTPKIIETELRKDIESHVRLFSYNNRYKNGRLNGEIKRDFGKPRSVMNIPELKKVLKHLKSKYPLDYKRGAGSRVTTKVMPFNY
jgi:superfamily II DNA or RNA helicase